jgi:Domain of unknown function (DUF6950)
MKRFPDWERRLAAEFAAARGKSFAWGVFDCALFACDCAQATAGEDPGAEFRGKYATEKEAAQLVGPSLAGFAAKIAAAHGMAEVKPGFARRGDIVLVDNAPPGAAASTALGVVDLGGRFALCASGRGLVRAAMKRWLRAWKVG